MKSIDQYYSEVKKRAFDHWQKEGYIAFKDMENDPVINLLLSALSYQAFRIQKDLEQQEERMLNDLCDRTVPYHLIKPVPAFTLVDSAIAHSSDKIIGEKTIDETCAFVLKNINFAPLLETKIINAKSVEIDRHENNVSLKLQLVTPIDSLAGMSLFIDTSETVNIEAIKCNEVELPIIKPSQYNELPFTKWFNNTHLFLNQNHHLFGTYDYWQEIFLDTYMNSFLIRQHGVERYNFNRLLGQMQNILHRYVSDYYAFLPVGGLKDNSQIEKMQEAINEIYDVTEQYEHTDTKEGYYAILKKNETNNNRNIHLSYLTTSGAAANGIKKNEKTIGTPNFLDQNKTVLLLNTTGGKDSVKDQAQKENIANYYLQTKDRLVTPADIRAFIRTFYYDEGKRLGDEIENIIIQRKSEHLSITIKLKDDSVLKQANKAFSLSKLLQSKLRLKSTGILPFRILIL
jgi:hypothetical protein